MTQVLDSNRITAITAEQPAEDAHPTTGLFTVNRGVNIPFLNLELNKIDNETISYVNVNGNQLVNCYRGQNGTTAVSHLTGAAITKQNLPCINVWPTPNPPGDQYTFVYYRLRRMQDAGDGGSYEQDMPFRLVNAAVAGLAYYLSMKKPEVSPDRIGMLKADYEQQWDLASSEDRDKAPIRFVPRNMFYYR